LEKVGKDRKEGTGYHGPPANEPMCNVGKFRRMMRIEGGQYWKLIGKTNKEGKVYPDGNSCQFKRATAYFGAYIWNLEW